MPIEIKELHIRINLNEQAKQTGASSAADIKKSVRESMEQVVKLIDKQKER